MRQLLLALFLSICSAASVNGGVIFTENSTEHNNVQVGFSFKIERLAGDLLSATLKNESTGTGVPTIDFFAFNLNPDANINPVNQDDLTGGYDMTVFDLDPNDWNVSIGSGGLKYDYLGTDVASGGTNGIAPQSTLTFQIRFSSSYLDTFIDANNANSIFTPFLNSENGENIDLGGGGLSGENVGQVAVKFQAIGDTPANDSLTLASDWELIGEGSNGNLPEPASFALWALMSVGVLSRRKRNA
ncbi:hypothetical protein [Planctomycetes bacterium SV_7m_r]